MAELVMALASQLVCRSPARTDSADHPLLASAAHVQPQPPPATRAEHMKERLRFLWAVLWRATDIFITSQALTHSAAVAFYTVLSLAPILVLLLWVSAALGADLQRRLLEELSSLIGMQGATLVDLVVNRAQTRVETGNLAGWISLGGIFVSATGVFAQMQVALNTVWTVQAKRAGLGIAAWLRKRLLSLGLILSLGFLLLVSLVLSSVLSLLLHSMRGTTPDALWFWTAIDLGLAFGVYVLVFMAIFRYVPDIQLEWRHVGFGSAVTAFLFAIGKWLLGLYLATSALGSAYGAAGSLALMLVWSYYSAAIVLFGAAITHARVHELHQKVRAEPIAEPTDGAAPAPQTHDVLPAKVASPEAPGWQRGPRGAR
jgi:membrane protein